MGGTKEKTDAPGPPDTLLRRRKPRTVREKRRRFTCVLGFRGGSFKPRYFFSRAVRTAQVLPSEVISTEPCHAVT